MQNINEKVQRLAAIRAEAARLVSEIMADMAALSQEIGAPPPQWSAATHSLVAGKLAKPAPVAVPTPARRTRAVITDAIRAKVKQLVHAGKGAAEIAKAVKISQPSVANIKKQLGLVKKK